MSDLRELYQQVILDHNKSPRNRGALAGAERHADGFNPLCGDRVTVHLHVEGDVVAGVSFEGEGCAISTAAASLMTQAVKGKTIAQVDDLFRAYQAMVTGNPGAPIDESLLGKLAVFQGVCEFPMRVKCATLAWHTLRSAIRDEAEGEPGTVTTE
jgi:nitrogen fixation NifU-like protein